MFELPNVYNFVCCLVLYLCLVRVVSLYTGLFKSALPVRLEIDYSLRMQFMFILTPGLRKTRGNLDYFGDIQKMKNSLRVELLFSNAAIYFIKHLDSHCIFTTVLGTIALVKNGL